MVPKSEQKSREQHSDASTAQTTSINWQDEGQAVNFPAGALCTEKMNLLNKTLSPAVHCRLWTLAWPLILLDFFSIGNELSHSEGRKMFFSTQI